MQRSLPAACTALTLLFLAAPADAKPKGLDQGEVIVNSKSTDNGVVVDMQAVIDAPIEKVWALIENCEDYTRTMPNIGSAKQLKKTSTGTRCEVIADLPFPLSDLRSVSDAVHTETADMKKRQWTLVEGDYKVNEGSWTLKRYGEKGDKTFVVYAAKLEPNMSIPNAILNLAQRRTLPKVIENLRKYSK